MELAEAIRHALDGNAILFTGAGFSLGATNQNGNEFPLANNLSELLLADIKNPEKLALQFAAEEYKAEKGSVGLLQYLQGQLGVRSVSDAQRMFARVPWQRVYTTNYDEVFEVAAKKEGRTAIPLTLKDKIEAPSKKNTQCIHLNGFLPATNIRNIDEDLILTETSYFTNRFLESDWSLAFKYDVDAARAVIFVGYSLADLDIAKVLIATSDLKRKCVFVVKENPGASLVRTLSKFGNHFPVGTSAAADHIREILPSHISSTSRREFFSFERYEPGISTDKPTTNDIFNLLVKGSVRSDYLSTSVRTRNFPYVIKREEVELISDKIRNGSSVTILLSRLGNGKSVLSEMICANLSSEFDVYSFVKETVAIDSEIELLRAPDRPTIIFIDDYPKHIETIRKLRLGSSNNQFLLLTARTPRHFTASSQLNSAINSEPALEIRLDNLSDDEINELDNLLMNAGLLGTYAQWNHKKRIHDIYRKDGNSEFSSILLWLLESETIQEKLSSSFEAITATGDLLKIVVTAMLLTHIRQSADTIEISEFLGSELINQALFSENSTIADFVKLDNRRIGAYSNLFASAFLRTFWKTGIVTRVMTDMLDVSWRHSRSNKKFSEINRDLMRYSYIKRIAPRANPYPHIKQYYETIRNHDGCATNPLFWLQFSIAEIEGKQFHLAEKYIQQSYALAKRRPGYDTFQIDNVHALLLLTREAEERLKNREMQSFTEATKIISRQIKERRHVYYPFRVATELLEFWFNVASKWEPAQKATFLNVCKSIRQHCDDAGADLRAMDDIRRCRNAMEKILSNPEVAPS